MNNLNVKIKILDSPPEVIIYTWCSLHIYMYQLAQHYLNKLDSRT